MRDMVSTITLLVAGLIVAKVINPNIGKNWLGQPLPPRVPDWDDAWDADD